MPLDTPLALARRAYNKALDQLEARRDAGEISAADAAVRARKLYAAYQTRKQDIELGAFLARHGLSRSVRMRGIDLAMLAEERPLAQIGEAA